MGTILTTTLDELLKRLYPSWEIEDTLNLSYPTLAECFGKGSAMLGGQGFYFPVRVESAEGHAFISENDDLPEGRNTVVRQANVPIKIQAGLVQLSGLSVAVSSGNAMAFARAFDENVNNTMEAMMAYREGVGFRDGTGILATVTTRDSGTQITVSDVGWIREGMYLAVFDKSTEGGTDEWIHGSGTGATAIRLKVDAVDWVNKTLTFSNVTVNAAVAATDEIYLAASQSEADGTAPSDKEPIGLEGSLLTSGTYLGIPRATYANWRSIVQAESGFLDEEVLLRARTRVTQETGRPFTNMGSYKLLCHPQQVDVLFKLAIPRIRYTGGDNVDLGNGTSVSFGGTKAVCSYAAPVDKAYLGDFSKSKCLYTVGGELHIDTEYNGAALKWVATKDVGLVFLKSYFAFAVTNPQSFVRITGLSTLSR